MISKNLNLNHFDRFCKEDDVLREDDVQPKGNTSRAWVHHLIQHLEPSCERNFQRKVSAFYIAA